MSSCAKRPEWEIQDYEWTGETLEIRSIPGLAGAYWYTPSKSGWIKYKTFGDKSEDLRTIIHCLCEPEEEKKNVISRDSPHELLKLFYHDPMNEKSTLIEISFKLKNDIFIGPLGKSKKLGKLFCKQRECGPYWVKPEIDPNVMKDVQEQLQEEIQKRIEEPNQAEP